MSNQSFCTPEGVEVLYRTETLVLRKIRRWTYRGEAFAECWLENGSGVEQRWGDTPLGLEGREGHVYFLVWANFPGQAKATLVGVTNLTTQRYELLGGGNAPVLNRMVADHSYGLWWGLLALAASVAAAFNWTNAQDLIPWLKPWHAIAFPFASAFVGFWVSIFSKREVDATASFNEVVKQVLSNEPATPVEAPVRRRRRRHQE